MGGSYQVSPSQYSCWKDDEAQQIYNGSRIKAYTHHAECMRIGRALNIQNTQPA